MKKFKYIAYLFFIVITTVLIILIYDTISKGESGKTSKEKALSEVEFLEGKIETLLNKMYNIETRNYNVSVIEITKQSEETKNKTTSTEGKEESGSSSSSGESSNSNLGSNSNEEPSAGSSGNQGVGQQGEKNKKYEMEEAGVLLDSGNINWSKVKSEIETLYSAIPTITLDLYQVNVSQDDILGFNKEFDKLTTAVKDENKEEILNELATIYEYIPKFMEKATDDEIANKLTKTKTHIYKAYSKLASKNWEEIGNEVKEARNIYSEILSKADLDKNKQYNISKGYVMLNEFQGAVDLQDETIFLIKYKNLIEGINNL